MQKEAKAQMSSSKNSQLSASSGIPSLIDPWDERIQRILGGPPTKTVTAEEAGIALEEGKLELKRKQWQLQRDEEEWELKKERDREEFELRKEERRAAAQKDALLFTLLSNRENREK